jgi:hypothetical protein
MVEGITALSALTGLTRLRLARPYYWESEAEEQLQNSRMLGSTLASLTKLQDLTLNYLSPGPIMEAMSQLTLLTKLQLDGTGPDLSRCLALLPRHIVVLYLE